MKRIQWFMGVTLLILMCLPRYSHAQQWSGIITPSRAADWSTAGVVGGIPDGSWANCVTAACNTLNGGTVTAASINAAVASAPNNAVVSVPSGSYTISGSCLAITRSNVALRGAGADQTKLSLSTSCSGGGMGMNRSFNIMNGSAGLGCASNCGGTAPSVVTSWSAGYALGTTTITLASVSGLQAGAPGTGSIILLDQLDDSANTGYPTANDIVQCSAAGAWCSNKGAGNQYGENGRSQVQVVTVTGISGSGPYTVTISPGIAFDNVRSSQSPQAYWNNSPIYNVGLENMTLDFTPAGNPIGLFIKDTVNNWITGVREINSASDTSAFYTNWIVNTAHLTFQSNYVYGKDTTCNPFPLENYAISTYEVSDSVFQNNIFHHTNNAYVPTDPSSRNVFAYNFVTGAIVGTAGAQPHGGEIAMDLYEGNDMQTFYDDVTHGTHMFMTLYRNLFDGTANNNGCVVSMAIAFLSNNRFNNVVGNVLGGPGYTGYEGDLEAYGSCGSATLFNLGGAGCNSGTATVPDANVKRTLLRWGNWDMFTSTNRTGTNDATGTRWCGSSLDTGWSTTCASTSETASAITNYLNAMPTKGDTAIGMAALPASFYLTNKPSWFGSVPFPAIGPDVANGNAPNTSTVPSGGHANRIPARVCYESLSNDAGYGSLDIKSFSAATCFPGVAPTLPAPPTDVSIVVD